MKWLVLKQTIKSKLSLFIIGIILSSNAMAVSLFTIKTSEFFQWHSEQNVRGYSQSFDEKILQGYIKDLKEKTVNILEDASKVDTLVLFSEVLNDIHHLQPSSEDYIKQVIVLSLRLTYFLSVHYERLGLYRNEKAIDSLWLKASTEQSLSGSGLNLCFCMNINPKFKLIDE